MSLRIHNLNFSYGNHKVLEIPEFNLSQGEMVFLYGPSGSGKSTLLELISGIHRPESGSLLVVGVDLSQLSLTELDQFRAQHIGYVFQIFNLVPYLTVKENIFLPLLFEKESETDVTPRLQRLIQHLKLSTILDKPASQLSVGQQQRVAVARALIKKPKLLLADEPTSALDYDHREGFLKILFELCKEDQTTVLFVSHDRTMEKQFHRSVNLLDLNKIKLNLSEIQQ